VFEPFPGRSVSGNGIQTGSGGRDGLVLTPVKSVWSMGIKGAYNDESLEMVRGFYATCRPAWHVRW
jgi:hypothetical protein